MTCNFLLLYYVHFTSSHIYIAIVPSIHSWSWWAKNSDVLPTTTKRCIESLMCKCA